jgi:hypothetical protein
VAQVSNSDSGTQLGDDAPQEYREMTVDEFEDECCAGSEARPYNKDRNKSVTMRYAYEEVDELCREGQKEAVADCVRQAMIALEVRKNSCSFVYPDFFFCLLHSALQLKSINVCHTYENSVESVHDFSISYATFNIFPRI